MREPAKHTGSVFLRTGCEDGGGVRERVHTNRRTGESVSESVALSCIVGGVGEWGGARGNDSPLCLRISVASLAVPSLLICEI